MASSRKRRRGRGRERTTDAKKDDERMRARRMVNWRGIPYYVARSVLGSQQWRSCLREVQQSDIQALADRHLGRLLRHACAQVPYYQALDLTDRPLGEYPVINKADLRRSPDRFQRDDLAHHRWSRIRTSGSTGETLEVIQDHAMNAWVDATDIWYHGQLLATTRRAFVSSPKVFVWTRPHSPETRPFSWHRLAQFAAPIVWLDPYEALSESKLLEYGRAISRARPAIIWGYAGTLYEIARVAQNRGLRLHKPRYIISSAETLHTFMRSVIEEAFGCRVFDRYGSTEAGRVAGECRAGNLHTFEFSCHVEVLDSSGQPALPGQEGRLILTPLHNYAMPLIRYDTADMAQVGPSECPCGCQLPTLSRIAGRTVEFLVSEEGHLISGGRMSDLLRDCPWIMGFQILQEDIDQVRVFFYRVADLAVSQADIDRVNAGIRAMLGVDCRILWQEVEEIPRTPNGKRPYARSLVWEQQQPGSLWGPP